MADILSQYTIMQQDDWAGRRFYTVQDRRSGQVVYLIEEWANGTVGPYEHPSLPHVQPLAEEGEIRWLIGALPEGDTLEDLRNDGRLGEHDMVSALISVTDGLANLSTLEPPVVPAYLDPACIRRDRLGRWVLDYLALAHAPEARMNTTPPLGVHPVGVLLYWLLTGQTARRTRVQVARIQRGVPPALQFIVIKCLGKTYTSLAALREDIERAGREHEFKQVVDLVAQQRRQAPASSLEPVRLSVSPPRPSEEQAHILGQVSMPTASPQVEPEITPRKIPVVQPSAPAPVGVAPTTSSNVAGNVAAKQGLPLDYRKVPLGGPYIPVDDKPWALPPRPQDGFRKYVVKPAPPLWKEELARWGALGLVSLLTFSLSAFLVLKLGLIPEEFLPDFLREQRLVSAFPGMANAGAQVGPEIPPDLPGPASRRQVLPAGRTAQQETQELIAEKLSTHKRSPTGSVNPVPSEGPTPNPPGDEVPFQPAAGDDTTSQPPQRPVPPPVTTPDQPPVVKPPVTPTPKPPETKPAPSEPALPPLTPLQPGSIPWLDARDGGSPMLIYLDGRPVGYAHMFPNPRNPYISLGAFNSLLGRNLYWAPMEGGAIRLYGSDHSFVTRDFDQVGDRIWLKLTPNLQDALGVSLVTASETGFYFDSRR